MKLNDFVNFQDVLLNDANSIIVLCDLNYNIYEFNKSAEEYFSCKKEYVFGKNYLQLCNSHDFEILSFNESITLFKQNTICKQIKIYTTHGLENIFNWKISILLNKSKEKNGIVFVGNNLTCITEKNYMSNFFFYLRKFSSSLPGFFYWKDKDGRYLGCSEDLLNTANLTRDEVVGKNDFDLWGKIADEIIQHDQETMQKNKLCTFKEEVKLPTEEKQYFIAIKIPLKDNNGNIIGIIGNSINITEQIKIEKELEKEKEELIRVNNIKDDFLSSMRHDFRTPFTGILGFSSYLEEQEVEQSKKDCLMSIKKAAQTLLEMLDEIFEYLEFKTKQETILLDNFTIQTIIQSVVDMFIPSIMDKNLDLKIECDENIPSNLIGNKLSLIRILINLLGNAVKFTNKGYIKVKAQLAKQEKRQVVIKLIVEDTGIGIPSDKHDFIFEKFSKLIPSYMGLYKGLGLGLSFVKQIIDELDGDIKVRSVLNKGSVFTCILPFKVALLPEESNET